MACDPDLFVSHSSTDADFTSRLVRVLRDALMVPPGQIRCTSLPGHGLVSGANSQEQLLREARESPAFVGVVTPASIKSTYVMFELGHRTAAKKPCRLLRAPGIPANILTGPLANIHAGDGGSREDVHQLIQALAEDLNIEPNSAGSYSAALEDLIAARPVEDSLPVEINAGAASDSRDDAPRLEIEAATNRLELYGRRISVYRAAVQLVQTSVAHADVSYQDIGWFDNETTEALFLCGPEIQQYLNDLRLKALELHHLAAKLGNPHLPVGDERSRAAKQEYDVLIWLSRQGEELEKLFLPLLNAHNV
jgi:hypothetical protein